MKTEKPLEAPAAPPEVSAAPNTSGNRFFQLHRRALAIFIFALLWFGIFAPLGIDPHHDGVMIKPAVDVAGGAMIFRDTFSQYGALSTWIQAAAVKIFGAELLVIKLLSVLFYAGSIVLIDRIWRRFLTPAFAWINLILCFGLAPELIVTFHPWSSIYALFFMLLATELLLDFLESEKSGPLFAAGVAAAAAFLCRHPCGVITIAAGTASLLLLCARPDKLHRVPGALAIYLGGVAALILPFAVLLTATGSWHDYIQQCVIYVAGFVHERGGGGFDFQKLSNSLFPIGSLFGLLDIFFSLLPLIVITMLLLSVRSIIHRRDTSLRRQLLAAVLLLGIGSWHQYYPVPCVRHVYWAALPMFGAYVLLMQMIRQLRWRPPARWALLLAAALLITPPVVIRLVAGALRLNGATARVYVSIPGIRGMLLFPSEAAAMEAISSAFNRQPAELRERGLFNHTNDGLFSIIARDAGYPRPMFVNWERGVYPDYPERARDFVAAKRPVVLTTEPGDQLPFPGYFNDLEFVWNEKRFRMLIPEEFAPAVRR